MKLLNGNGTILSSGPQVMYYASAVEYFGEDRIPFAVVSICVAFIVFPALLLVLYPTRIFRRCIIAVNLGGGMHYTLSWKHFRDSSRMEPMVHETSEWFLHCTLSTGILRCFSILRML